MPSLQQTLRLSPDRVGLHRAAGILQQGGLVAIPTETVYGLAANALNISAVGRIFAAKQRPAWDPLIVHLGSLDRLNLVTGELSPAARTLAGEFWPGPLTMLLPRAPAVPPLVTAGRELVGVRIPAHPVTRTLLEICKLPLAAPSANRFGHISPTTADHVLADLDGRIDAVMDAGPSSLGLESTVVDPATDPVTIYRLGAIGPAEIAARTGLMSRVYESNAQVRTERVTSREALPAPGIGIRHYAPTASLLLVNNQQEFLEITARYPAAGVLRPDGWTLALNHTGPKRQWADWNDTPGLARTFYAALRELDALQPGRIIVPIPQSLDAISQALRDRLSKASRPA